MSQNLDDKQILNIIAEIDRLKIIQAQHITNGDLEKALEVSNTISELAKKIKSPYIIDEQQDYLSNISTNKDVTSNFQDIKLIGNELKKNFYELLEIEHVVQAHELIENFKKKYGSNFNLHKISSVNECIQDDERIWKRYLQEQANKVENLEELESEFFLAIKKGDIKTANQIIEKAWDNIYKLEGSKKEVYQNKWGTLEHNLIQGLKYEEYETIKSNENRIRKVLDESKTMEKKFQYDKAISILNTELKSNQIKDIRDLRMELEIRLADIQASKTLHNKTNKNNDLLREQQVREQQIREQQLREQQIREQQIREQQIREQQLREQQIREQQIREQQLREQQIREQQIREQQIREQQIREQQIREQQIRDQQLNILNALKDQVLILNKEGLELLNKRDTIKALEKYRAIKNLIIGHIKK